MDQIERNYVKDISRRELMEAAIRGMISKLDPYSNYISPDEIGGFKTSVENQFGGIGIQITIEEGALKVLSPLIDTPAYRAGIQAGDRITKIEGAATDGLSIDEAVRKLKGEVGTKVTLTFQHPGQSKGETVTLKREVVQVETVLGDQRDERDHWRFMFDDEHKIGYLRIAAFSGQTAKDVRNALEQLTAAKMKGLILDLRFNPGGLLTSAIEISDLFVAEGVIVSTEGRNSPKKVWNAKKEGTFTGFSVAVLVNRYSASASEILAACLQDHDVAVVVGERSWGKGSVQNVIELEDGKSALKLTTAGYLRPNGHNIHRFPNAKDTDEWGVKPNDGYEVKLSDAEMAKLMVYRRERDILISKKKSPEEKGDSVKHDTLKKENAKADNGKADSTESDGAKTELASTKTLIEMDRQLQKALDYLVNPPAKK
jgi:carboxyl-terminal processing protease